MIKYNGRLIGGAGPRYGLLGRGWIHGFMERFGAGARDLSLDLSVDALLSKVGGPRRLGMNAEPESAVP